MIFFMAHNLLLLGLSTAFHLHWGISCFQKPTSVLSSYRTELFATKCPTKNLEERDSLWIQYNEISTLSDLSNTSIEDFHSQHVDVTYIKEEPHSDSSSSGQKTKSIFRLRRNSTNICSIAEANLSICKPISSQTTIAVENAAKITYRWCSNFVEHLNLCPWAKQSLSSDNAIRIKVVDQSDGLNMMENVIRESSLELKKLTGDGVVDPYIGITFVVAIPDDKETLGMQDFDFMPFFNFFNDLEDRFLDEAEDEDGIHLFDEVTIAPFHPHWSFASSTSDEDDPVSFEKRTPLPTISIVMSKGIHMAGEETTARIGEHNEGVLHDIGSTALTQLFNDRVLNNNK